MRNPAVARNYAEALLELADRSGEAERFGELTDGFGGACEDDETIRVVPQWPGGRAEPRIETARVPGR